MLRPLRLVLFLGLGLAAMFTTAADPIAITTYPTRDSLSKLHDPLPDADACLAALSWAPESFEVTVQESDTGPHLVRFPSPIETGNPISDRVAMQWYVARDQQGKALNRPAIVVVHESGSAMPVGRLFAKTLSLYGVHAFLIHMPHYGERRGSDSNAGGRDVIRLMRQAVADVRRAHDAVAALPHVDASRISLQGTSLGGFVVALTGSLDHAFRDVFITLAGGDFYSLIANGEKDTAKMRQQLAEAGYTGEKLRRLVQQVEPLRVAHRLRPRHTWIFSGRSDRVVPLNNAKALADAAKIPSDHHVIVPANHYTAILYFPTIIDQIVRLTLPADLIPAELAND